MIERHLMRLRARDTVSAEEEQAIRDAVAEVRDYPADKTFIRADEELNFSTLILEGLVSRYRDMRNGQRQISELHVPGDFADLHSFTLKRLDHGMMALTAAKVGIVPHDRLKALTEQHPHLARLYWFSTNLDAAIHREWMVSLGRRNALSRTAHLFCELYVRLGLVGLTEGDRYRLDLIQAELAECLGLTGVHINRTLKELRELGLAEFRSGWVTILDLKGLERVAEFDPGYLYLERRPL